MSYHLFVGIPKHDKPTCHPKTQATKCQNFQQRQRCRSVNMMFYDTKLFLLMFPVVSPAQPTIIPRIASRINYGIFYRAVAMVEASPDYWVHSFQLSLPTMYSKRVPQMCSNSTIKNCTLSDFCTNLQKVIDSI